MIICNLILQQQSLGDSDEEGVVVEWICASYEGICASYEESKRSVLDGS